MIPPLRRIGPATALAVALAAPGAFAQSRPEPTAATKDAPADPRRPDAGFSPFGDPSRFTRMGGWGGMGSGMAQFGMAKTVLLMTPAVQKELKLTDDQLKSLREWGDDLRKRGEAAFRRQAEAGANAGNPGDPNNPDPGPGRAAGAQGPPGGPPSPLAMIELITTITREGEAGLARILDKRQRLRLNQIALQMEGVSALARPEVAEAIYLSPEQQETIQGILGESKARQIGHFLTQGFAMRGRGGPDPGNPGGPPPRADGQAEAKKAEAKEEDPEAQARRRQAERTRRQAEFTRFRDGSDRIQDETTTKILRVLAKKQRERFDKLLGEPFDPNKLAGPGGFGGPGAPATPETKPAGAPRPAEPAPTRSSRLRDARFKGESKPSQP